MIRIFLVLFTFCCFAEQPKLTTVLAPNSNHLGIAFYWTQPTNEVWVSEWSTNLVTWQRCGNETVLTGGLCFTETSSNQFPQLFIRLRKISL